MIEDQNIVSTHHCKLLTCFRYLIIIKKKRNHFVAIERVVREAAILNHHSLYLITLKENLRIKMKKLDRKKDIN